MDTIPLEPGPFHAFHFIEGAAVIGGDNESTEQVRTPLPDRLHGYALEYWGVQFPPISIEGGLHQHPFRIDRMVATAPFWTDAWLEWVRDESAVGGSRWSIHGQGTVSAAEVQRIAQALMFVQDFQESRGRLAGPSLPEYAKWCHLAIWKGRREARKLFIAERRLSAQRDGRPSDPQARYEWAEEWDKNIGEHLRKRERRNPAK